jgi:hypothetical protein
MVLARRRMAGQPIIGPFLCASAEQFMRWLKEVYLP